MIHGDVTYTDEALYANKLSMVYEDIEAARETLDAVREFIRNHPTVYLSTHTPLGYENLEHGKIIDLDNPPESIPPEAVSVKEATGKYIFCIDSDDVIEPETIETLVKICNETGSELCISSYRRFKDPYIRQSYPEMHSSILDAKEATRRMTCDMGFTHSSCGKLYLRSLWEGITFPEGKIYEDYQTTFKLIARAEKVAYCDARFYCYRIRSGSIMRTKVQEINIELLDISSVVTEELTRLYPDMEEIILYQKARTYLRLMKNILNAGFDVFPDAQQRIISYIKSEKENLLASSVVKKVDKIKVRTLCMGRRVFYLAYKIGNLKNRNMQD